MQVSVQTDRKKKTNNLQSNLLIPNEKVKSVSVEQDEQAEKEKQIKKLALVNKELIETLKRQSEQLSKRISKQKLKGQYRSTSVNMDQGKGTEREKTQLSNAYKQIQMYKSILQNLKAKQTSTESIDKLNQIENKIKIQDTVIEQLQKELKYVKNIKEQQEKQLNLYSNDQMKLSVGELEEEIKKMKEKVRNLRKQMKKREQIQKKQHIYYIQLDKALRKHNDEYYPGKNQIRKQPKKEVVEMEEITQRDWQLVKAQLIELKRSHDENNKKIQNLGRMRVKQIKSLEENEMKLKEKTRKLQSLKTKVVELAKLVTVKEDNQKINEDTNEDDSNKKVKKNPDDEREAKRWLIPHGYYLEKGKIIPDSIFFSDKNVLKNVKKSKIMEVHIWVDGSNVPCMFQFYYLSQNDKVIQGLLPHPLSGLSHLEEKIVEFKENDSLVCIKGKFLQGCLTSISFLSKYGNKSSFNEHAHGQDFRFEPRPNEIPSCMFGAFVKNELDQLRICHLGCEFMKDW